MKKVRHLVRMEEIMAAYKSLAGEENLEDVDVERKRSVLESGIET
jgi:hypothetical protein